MVLLHIHTKHGILSESIPIEQLGTVSFGVLQVHAAEVALYGRPHARMKQFTFKTEAERLQPLPREAFLGDAPLSPEEVVPGGDFAQHVLQDIMEPAGSVGAGLLRLTNSLQGGFQGRPAQRPVGVLCRLASIP